MIHFHDDKRLRAALVQLGRQESAGAPVRVEVELLESLRRRRRLRWLRQAAPLGLAAALLLVLLAGRKPAPLPPAEERALLIAPAPEPPTAPRRQPAPETSRPPSRPALVVPVRAPVESDFIALGAWQAIEPMERGSIVRVRLPNSVLSGFGIPVSPERWNETTPADVLLAEDGSIRAVRFLSTRH